MLHYKDLVLGKTYITTGIIDHRSFINTRLKVYLRYPDGSLQFYVENWGEMKPFFWWGHTSYLSNCIFLEADSGSGMEYKRQQVINKVQQLEKKFVDRQNKKPSFKSNTDALNLHVAEMMSRYRVLLSGT